MRNARHRINVGRELNPLIEFAGANLRDQCSAEGEDDVAVLVGVLEDGVAVIAGEFPPARLDDLTVTIEGFVGGDEVETRIAGMWFVKQRFLNFKDFFPGGIVLNGCFWPEAEDRALRGRNLSAVFRTLNRQVGKPWKGLPSCAPPGG